MSLTKLTVVNLLANSLSTLFISLPDHLPTNNKQELWDLVEKTTQASELTSLLLVIFETEASFVGKETTLELGKYSCVKVIRFTKANELYRKLGLDGWPAAAYIRRNLSVGLIKIEMNQNSVHLLTKAVIDANNIYEDLKATIPSSSAYVPKGISGANKQDGNLEHFPNSGDVVGMKCLIPALRYSLRNKVGLLKKISGNKLQALKNYIHVLVELFPAEQIGMGNLLANLNSWMLPFKEIDDNSYLDKLTELETEFHPWDVAISTRKTSCSLWTLFHTLAVIANEKNLRIPVSKALDGYLKEFVGCKECFKYFWKSIFDDGANKVRSYKGQEDPVYLQSVYTDKDKCYECPEITKPVESFDNLDSSRINLTQIINGSSPHYEPKLDKGNIRYKRSASDDESEKNADFFTAIRKDNLEEVKSLLKEMTNVNIIDKNNKDNTPLHVAVSKGNRNRGLEIVKLLLEHGAKINTENSRGEKPLDIAKKLNNEDIIKELEEHSKSLPGSSRSVASNNQLPNKPKLSGTDLDETKDGSSSKEKVPLELEPLKDLEPVSAADTKSTHYKKGGLANSLHGTIFQLKLLMLFVWRGIRKELSFSLSTEWNAAEKFDDVVFEYKEGDKKVYRFLQAKHKQDETEQISVNDLLTKSDAKFSLQKYFISFRKIRENPQFNGQDVELKDFVICTNIDLSDELQSSFEPVAPDDDDLLNVQWDGRKSKQLKFKLKDLKEEKNKRLISILEDTSDLNRLAKELATCLYKKKNLNLQGELFNSYHVVLGKEVLDVKKNIATFRDSFIKGDQFQKFRIAFKKAYFEITKQEVDDKIFLKEMKTSTNFGKVGKEKSSLKSKLADDLITEQDISGFFEKLVFAVNQPNEDQLGQIIQKEIGKEFTFLNSEEDYHRVFVRMLDWMKEKQGRFLSHVEGNAFFKEARRGLSIWFDVNEPVLSFTGRVKELEELHSTIQRVNQISNVEQNKVKVTVVSHYVSGLGGIGKSELLREYIRKKSQDYDRNVVWINAETYETLTQSFTRLAKDKLDISMQDIRGQPKDIKSVVEDVYLCFVKKKSLFIFDNAEKYASIFDFLPRLSNDANKPYIIVTSRNQLWPDAKVLILDVFTEEEAVEFIKKSLNTQKNKQVDVEKLAKSLQYFPLALQQAVAYIKNRDRSLKSVDSGFTISNYLEKYEKETETLLNYKFPEDSSDLYTKTTLTTWIITIDSIRKIEEHGRLAADILEISSYFAPENIPSELFLELDTEKEKIGDAIQLLKQYSMINSGDGKISIHSLVQQVTRLELENKGRDNEVIIRAYDLITKYGFPVEGSFTQHAHVRQIMPLLETYLTHTYDWEAEKPKHKQMLASDTGELLRLIGFGYSNTDTLKSIECFKRALSIFEQCCSSEKIDMASNILAQINVLVDLSMTYSAIENYEEAKNSLKRSLKIQRNYFEENHPKIANTLGLLGTVYVKLGNSVKGNQLLDRDLSILKNRYDENSYELIKEIVSLDYYGVSDDPKTKKVFLDKALSVLENHHIIYPDDHVIADVLSKLGDVNGALGNTEEACKNYKRASKIGLATPLFLAAKSGNIEPIKDLLDHTILDTNINSRFSALNGAVVGGNEEVTRFILEKIEKKYNQDFPKYLNAKDEDGNTPLIVACHLGKPNLAKVLLEFGANPLLKDNKDVTVLHDAVRSGDSDTINLIVETLETRQDFLKHLDAKDNFGETPLMLAARLRRVNAVKLLLHKGADSLLKDNQGMSVLDRAIHNDDKNMQRLIGDNIFQRLSNQDILKSDSQNVHQDGVSGTHEECPPSTSSGSSSRRKREAKECELSWEDIDEFNMEKEEIRAFSKIKINSDKFIDYINGESMSEAKLDQLIHLASKVEVYGTFQNLVHKLTSNQKVMNHLNRVGTVSGIVMHGMMAKNVVSDFINGDYEGVAINLGFIAGGQGFARVAQTTFIKGTQFISDERIFLGRSLRAASPFLARGTSAFVAYDLVNQIQEYKRGNKDAMVGVVGDSIYIGVDAGEIGIELAEAFEVLEGVSSITGPIGGAIGAMVFVGTDVYLAVKRVNRIDEMIHLTSKEMFIEGLRGFFGIQPKQYLEELIEEKQVNTEFVNQGLEYLKQNPNIRIYIFPTGRSVTDSCQTEECPSKIQVDLNNTILLDRKRSDIKLSRAKPTDPGEGKFICLPQGNSESVPTNGSYLCKDAIGIEYSKNRSGSDTLISLGNGDDVVVGFPQGNHILVLGNGYKNITLGSGNDSILLQGTNISGIIYGGNGTNTLDLGLFANEKFARVVLAKAFGLVYYETDGEISHTLRVHGMNDILLRTHKADYLYTACDTKFVDGRGGESRNLPDRIVIPRDGNCSYEMTLVVRPFTEITNYAAYGNFTYIIPPINTDKGLINLTTLNSSGMYYKFVFGYTLYDINKIEVGNNTVRFSFIPGVGHPRFDSKEMNTSYKTGYEISISNNAPNALYQLSDNTEIKVGLKNIYAIQLTDKSVDEIVSDYSAIANNLRMSIFVQCLLNNETVSIGHGNHDVLHNDPNYKSHLIGNGGENVFVVTSDDDVLHKSQLPIPEVVIYDLDDQNLLDTLDLRQIKQQVKGICEEINAKTVLNNRDLLIELLCLRGNEVNESVVTVRLKDALISNWYERLHVIVHNVPMKIEGFELKPLPLIFDDDKTIIVIGSQDIEKDSQVIVSRDIGNYTFCRFGNDLIITNAFDDNITDTKLCSISFSNFYKEEKLQTLDLRFYDKQIVMNDHKEEISVARELNIVQREFKEQVYNALFNHTRSEVIRRIWIYK